MRKDFPEKNRVKAGPFASEAGDTFGCFLFSVSSKVCLTAVVDNGQDTGWEHVSVTVKGWVDLSLNRTPTWGEMCFVKDKFWGEDETVIQFHPKKSEYKNVHPNCLHLWKKKDVDAELPPSILV